MNRKGLTNEQIIQNDMRCRRDYLRKNIVSTTLSIYLFEFSGAIAKNNHSKIKTLAAMLSVSINKKTNAVILGHALRYGRSVFSPTRHARQTHQHLMDNLRKKRNLQKQYERLKVVFSTTQEAGVMITESIKEKDPVCLISFKSNNKNNRRLKYIDA